MAGETGGSKAGGKIKSGSKAGGKIKGGSKAGGKIKGGSDDGAKRREIQWREKRAGKNLAGEKMHGGK